MTEPAHARFARLIAMIAWLNERPGVTVTETAETFAISESQVLADVALLTLTGVGEYHGELIDIDWDESSPHLTVNDPQNLDRPLRLSVAEAAALLGGLRLLDQTGVVADPAAIHEVQRLIEDAAARTVHGVDVLVDGGGDDVAAAVRAGCEQRRVVHLTYAGGGADAVTERDVHPWRLFTMEGRTYLEGWCERAEDRRVFRLDRILAADLLDRPADPPPAAAADDDGPQRHARPRGPMATLEVEPGGRWWADTVPVVSVDDRGDGGAVVRLEVGEPRWVVRQVLRLGGAMAVRDPHELSVMVRERALAALAAYGEAVSDPAHLDAV